MICEEKELPTDKALEEDAQQPLEDEEEEGSYYYKPERLDYNLEALFLAKPDPFAVRYSMRCPPFE